MKNTFCAIVAIAGLLFAQTISAQETAEKKPHGKKKHVLTLTTGGLKVYSVDSTKKTTSESNVDEHEKRKFFTSIGPVDLGLNLLADNTNYSDPSVKNFLHVPANAQNKSLFDLRTGKSVNVNVYPFMLSYRAVKTHNQRIYISSGLGLQLYNFRYEAPLTYTKNPSGVILDTISFKKDKLALDYLNVPLMFTFKTRISKKDWLVYGVGITEGYLISSWTKQESGQRGKVKMHDAFGLASTNTCVSAEIGLDDMFRFYFTYQLTSLYTNGLDQHPFSFGIRFSGI